MSLLYQYLDAVRVPSPVAPVYNAVLTRWLSYRIWGLLDPLVSPFWDVAKVDFWRIQINGTPSDGDTLVVGGDTWTWRSAPSGVDPYEIGIPPAPTNNTVRDAAILAINANPDSLARYYAQPIGTTYTDPDGGPQVVGLTNITIHIFGRTPGVALNVTHTGSWTAAGFPENTVSASAGSPRNNYRLWAYLEAEDGWHNSGQWRRLPPVQAALRPPYAQGSDTRLATALWGDLDFSGVLQLAVFPDRAPFPNETLPTPYLNAIRRYRLRVGDAWDSLDTPQRRGSFGVEAEFRALYANLGDQNVGWGWGPDDPNCGLASGNPPLAGVQDLPYADPLAAYFPPLGDTLRQWVDENATTQQPYLPGQQRWLNLWLTPDTWQGTNPPYLNYSTATGSGPVERTQTLGTLADCNGFGVAVNHAIQPSLLRVPLTELADAMSVPGGGCVTIEAFRPACPEDTQTWYLPIPSILFGADEASPTGSGLPGTWALQFDGGPHDYHFDEVPDLPLPQLPLDPATQYQLQEDTVRQILAYWAADLENRYPGTTASWRYGGVPSEGEHVGYIQLSCVDVADTPDFLNPVFYAIRGAVNSASYQSAWILAPLNYQDSPVPSDNWTPTGTGPVFDSTWDEPWPISEPLLICPEPVPAACEMHTFAFINKFGAWECLNAWGPWQRLAEPDRIDGSQTPDAYGPARVPAAYSNRPGAKRGSLSRRTTLQDAYTVNTGLLPIDQLANYRALFGSRKVAWLRPGGTEYVPVTITNADAVTIDDTIGTVGSIDIEFVAANPKVSQDA